MYFQVPVVKSLPASAGDLEMWVRSLGWGDSLEYFYSRQPTPGFFPGKVHGQRSPQAAVHGLLKVGEEWAHTHLFFFRFLPTQVIAECWEELPVLYGRSLLVVCFISRGNICQSHPNLSLPLPFCGLCLFSATHPGDCNLNEDKNFIK